MIHLIKFRFPSLIPRQSFSNPLAKRSPSRTRHIHPLRSGHARRPTVPRPAGPPRTDLFDIFDVGRSGAVPPPPLARRGRVHHLRLRMAIRGRPGQHADAEQPEDQQRAGDGSEDDAGDSAAGDGGRAVVAAGRPGGLAGDDDRSLEITKNFESV
jgi:hypothetical protein